jgi:hypothetical protein
VQELQKVFCRHAAQRLSDPRKDLGIGWSGIYPLRHKDEGDAHASRRGVATSSVRSRHNRGRHEHPLSDEQVVLLVNKSIRDLLLIRLGSVAGSRNRINSSGVQGGQLGHAHSMAIPAATSEI